MDFYGDLHQIKPTDDEDCDKWDNAFTWQLSKEAIEKLMILIAECDCCEENVGDLLAILQGFPKTTWNIKSAYCSI